LSLVAGPAAALFKSIASINLTHVPYAGTPRQVIARLNDVAARVVRAADTRARLVALGADAIGNSPEAFRSFLRADFERNGTIVKRAGVKID
jgi:tripartite-type tricarboxylate transporter receptor subunit TctC